jgi:hypothetical protein
MAVNREWVCNFHEHEFESTEDHPACPFGCAPQYVSLEFRTPPSIRHGVTTRTDAIRRQIAQDYNMTDVRGDKEGSSVMSNTRIESGGARVIGDKGAPYWKPDLVPQGWRDRGEPAPALNPKAMGLLPPTTRQGNRDVPAYIPVSEIQKGARSHLRRATVIMKQPGQK